MTELQHSISEPIREGLTWDETWSASDDGLIMCWEVGRKLRDKDSALAKRAENGELVPLPWKGGVEARLKKAKPGTLKYLAMWQGLRGDDLQVDLEAEQSIVCTRFQQQVIFSSQFTFEDE